MKMFSNIRKKAKVCVEDEAKPQGSKLREVTQICWFVNVVKSCLSLKKNHWNPRAIYVGLGRLVKYGLFLEVGVCW